SFCDYLFDIRTGLAQFHYQLRSENGVIDFEERIQFAHDSEVPFDQGRLDPLLALLGAVLGVSYYKVSVAPLVNLEVGIFTAQAIDYLRAIYSHGLGEFAFRNGLDGLPTQEFRHGPLKADVRASAMNAERLQHPLLPVGGGKDSAVSAMALENAGLIVHPFAVNPNDIHRRVAAITGNPLVEARRSIDPMLFALNDIGALNGHVPVTAMNSIIAVIQSLLIGLGPVVMSNESSSSEPTVDWDGVPVNHQWSKSLEAETMLAATLESQAGLQDSYFSLLRPFTELVIARAFAKRTEYDHLIVSCNRAFRIHNAEPSWCADCPKCRFVFLAFSAFMSRDRLVGIIGKNMFEDAGQLSGFRELIGLDEHKPWECVGEEAESVVAITLAAHNPEWAESAVIQALIAEAPELGQSDGNPLQNEVFRTRAGLALPSPQYKKAQAFVSPHFHLSELAGKRVGIFGVGREGNAVLAKVLEQHPASIIAFDDKKGPGFQLWEQGFGELAPAQLSSEHDPSDHIDVLIKSPGISKYHDFVQQLAAQGTIITGSTALWLEEHAERTIAVTGSKGKSTTASLIYHLIRELIEPEVAFGGNIGIPMFSLPEAPRYVVELGSYQSSEVQQSPDTVVVTALFPEHLDWHRSEAQYFSDKLNLLGHGAKRIVLNGRDARLLAEFKQRYPELPFETVQSGSGVYLENYRADGSEHEDSYFFMDGAPLFPSSVVRLSGVHNSWNAALALTVLSAELDLVVNAEAVASALGSFEPLEHRLTPHRSGGLVFVDDSLSTSPFATIAALESFPDQELIVLIGGQDRGVDYQPLYDYLEQHPVQGLIGLSDSGAKLLALLEPLAIESYSAKDMLDAVQAARKMAKPGTVVLMSPGAPSYGVFKDFADRAEKFVEAIAKTND
ncbi:MAG: UDP-N-acetylmuramoyl-L-alanine--D-glutamate ligase, partial [Microbacteriaceae bacterium]